MKTKILASAQKVIIFLKKNFKKKVIIIFSSLLIFSLALLFVAMSFYASWWKFWPSTFRFTIALNRLAISVYEDPYCHLDCFLEREVYRQELLRHLNKPQHLQKISKIIFNEDENINWRLELLAIVLSDEKLSERALFSDLEEYLLVEGGNLKIQSVLATYFSSSSAKLGYLEKLKATISDSSISSEERVMALEVVKNVDKSLAPFYLDLLKNSQNNDLTLQLLRSLASDEARFDIDRSEMALSLENIFLSSNSSFTSRRLLIFILSDFLEEEPAGPVFSLMEKLFLSPQVSDFDKYFIASTLFDKFPNSNFQEKYALRNIEEAEWLWYGEQK